MGEAKRRGTYEERVRMAKAVETGHRPAQVGHVSKRSLSPAASKSLMHAVVAGLLAGLSMPVTKGGYK